ncbi:hypothetical protein NDU88_002440 [Pleurodeles waltl]|uniref:Uncharacterized protein n=1 Tax=Pleurodeles waltl TaxID=8319 RepID=A0AAV7WNK8_PLEWA|nr:hypothetical protein NDU88_002440 [Pleurodeles waltl]
MRGGSLTEEAPWRAVRLVVNRRVCDAVALRLRSCLTGPGPGCVWDCPAAPGERRIPGWPRQGRAPRGAEYQRTTTGPEVRYSDAALCGASLEVDGLPGGARLLRQGGSGPRLPVRWSPMRVVCSGRLGYLDRTDS